MKLIICSLVITLILVGCGQNNPSDSNKSVNEASLLARANDVLANSNWELSGEGGGKLGFYFGANGEFLRSAYKTSPAVQSMGVRGTYSISADGNLVMTATHKTCPTIGGNAQYSTPFVVKQDYLQFGSSSTFVFPKVAKSFEEQFGGVIQWGCISNSGDFTPGAWHPF